MRRGRDGGWNSVWQRGCTDGGAPLCLTVIKRAWYAPWYCYSSTNLDFDALALKWNRKKFILHLLPITYIDDNDNIFNANVEIDGCGFGIYLRRNFCSNRFRVIFISIFQMCICQMIRTNGNRNPRNDEERFPLCYMFEWFGVKTLLHLRTTTR